VDPLAEKYPGVGSYVYCYNNPVKFVDPDGRAVETIWDAASAAIGVKSFFSNVKKGNVGGEIVDGVGVAYDGVATVIPLLPGGLGALIKAVRGGEKAAEALNAVNNGSKTIDNVVDARNGAKLFDGGASTNSKTSNEALRKAKDANGIPRSQQPDKTVKTNTPEGSKAGLDARNVKQFEYTNSKGEKVTIRQDKPAIYTDGWAQPAHYNAGKNKKLDQHHNY